MAAERMTVKQWCHHLEAPDALLTLSEFMALCLLHIRENGKLDREATEHVEGMVGTLDGFLHAVNEDYREIADKRSRPVPMLPEREAS